MVDISKFKDAFLSEAEELLENLNQNLLLLEKKPSSAKLLNELMRCCHTLKSSSATMGFVKLAYLTHVLEDVFDYARNDKLKIDSKLVSEMFKAFDWLKKSINSIKDTDQEVDVDNISEKIKEITGVATEGIGKSKKDVAVQAQVAQKKGKSQSIEEAHVSEADQLEKISHVKVPVERLDNLLDLTEELIINRMKVEAVVASLLEKQDNMDLLELRTRQYLVEKLRPVVNQFSRLSSNLQFQVMQTRLVPVGQIFARFPRMVRDLANQEKKKIELKIKGEELELDRTIVDKLAEPLVHLLRNAVDHGIETKGNIYLEARREKDHTVISVADDGRNIDYNQIKLAAVRRNIVSSTQVDSYSEEQLISLLFHPNFSTKSQVSETSGRGVGLSVVKQFIDELGGRVFVDAALPQGGSSFTLELPLTLAIINALLVKVKKEIYAIPFSAIERTVKVQPHQIKSIADQDIAIVAGQDVPLARLDKLFNLSFQKAFSFVKDEEHKETTGRMTAKTLVLVKRQKRVAGLVVDELLNEQEIIVKPLPSILKGVRGFSGSTILGQGETILILDVNSLLEDKTKLLRT